MGSFQVPAGMQNSALLETSCGYLLQELQMIWDEIGEDQFEREKVLLDLERECLEVYRRKVDNANSSRARLHQELADSEAEFTHLLLSLGERSLPGRPEKMAGTLKEQLDSITPALREMRLRKQERVNQFRAVQEQIQKISAEIAGKSGYDDSPSNIIVNENDLSLNKLEEYQVELKGLQDKKIDRLQRVEKYTSKIRNLSETLGMDYSLIVTKAHPSLNELSGMPKNISDSILATLNGTLKFLEEEKQNRLSKLHQLGKALTNLWDLMDTSYEDRRMFSHVTSLLSISPSEVSDPRSLTLDIIQQAEAEVKRLDQLKASKMKELFLKKQMELEDICNKSHMEFPSRSEMERILNLINAGDIDHADLLESMDEQINRAREEASSRHAIMERVDKWMSARDEERWLDEYNRDENRYSVSRGAHRNLKRAERARVIVSKIPALLDMLIAKTKCWEEERDKVFLYDEIPLLAMLEEYNLLRFEKEKEKQIQREKKKIQNQKVSAHEHLYIPRPGTSSSRISNRSINGGLTSRTHSSRRLAPGINILGPNSIYFEGEGNSFIQEDKKALRQKIFARSSMVSHPREETATEVSSLTGPFSP